MSIGKEVIVLKSRIAAIKKEERECDHIADAYITAIRDIVDPYGGDFRDFASDKMEKFMVLAKGFYEIWEKAIKLRDDRRRMEHDLHG